MRIRYPFAGAFVLLFIFAGYLGLLPHSSLPDHLRPNDKVLHLVTFFLLSLIFYWIPDTTRRRTLQMTILVCTLVLGIGSEIVQALLPNGRSFDPFDVLANLVGSLGAVGLCSWYHRRMLDRRRKARFGALADGAEDDVELGIGTGDNAAHDGAALGSHETGVMTLEQEVENWDENAVDNWDTEDGPDEDDTLVGTGAAGEGRRASATTGTEARNSPDEKKTSK
ncbi:hypothetical protein V8E54_011358 [Elaphomyces granulatus]